MKSDGSRLSVLLRVYRLMIFPEGMSNRSIPVLKVPTHNRLSSASRPWILVAESGWAGLVREKFVISPVAGL